MATARNILKNWFSRGKKPTGKQFSDLIDSFWHKDEVNFNPDASVSITLIWQEPVANVAALTTTYPEPETNWAAMVEDVGFIYSWNGNEWVNTGLKAFPEDVALKDGGTSTIKELEDGKADKSELNTWKTDKILAFTTDAATTRKNILSADRKAGLKITYNNGSKWINEQYIGTEFTDTEWQKDDNWSEYGGGSGGGISSEKFLITINDINAGYLKTDGTIGGGVGYVTSYIDVLPNDEIYQESNNTVGTGNVAMCGYLNGTFVSVLLNKTSLVDGGVRVIIPEGINQIRCHYVGTDFKLYKVGNIIGSEDKKTLLDFLSRDYTSEIPFLTENGYISLSGVPTMVGTQWKISPFIDVREGEKMFFEGASSGATIAIAGYLDENFVQVIKAVSTYKIGGNPFIVPIGVNRIRCCVSKSSPTFKIYRYGFDESYAKVTTEFYENLKIVLDSYMIIPIQYEEKNGFYGTLGGYNSSSNWRNTGLINVNPSEIMFYTGANDFGSGVSAVSFWKDGVFVRSWFGIMGMQNRLRFIIPADGSVNQVIATFYIPNSTSMKLERYGVLPSISPKYQLNKSWHCLGHSIWWQDGNTYSDGSICIGVQTLLKQKIQFTKYTTSATSGSTIGRVLSGAIPSTPSDIYTWDTVVNDLTNTPLGVPADFDNSTGSATFYGALKELHKALKTINPNYIMLAGNCLYRAGADVIQYNDAVKYACEKLGWVLVDQFNGCMFDSDNLAIFTRDGTHPNNAGYERIHGIWLDAFRRLG